MGLERASVEEVCTPPPVLLVVEPDAALADRYTMQMPRFRGLYQHLKNSFRETAP
jgi:hypothetical protein